jgi:hypothetical protein
MAPTSSDPTSPIVDLQQSLLVNDIVCAPFELEYFRTIAVEVARPRCRQGDSMMCAGERPARRGSCPLCGGHMK